ncbi:MAG: hypothetical protein OZ921_21105, partial [Sorangiineae bacterium]|nr:hypothetical protein [Sorangiineae bacterium]
MIYEGPRRTRSPLLGLGAAMLLALPSCSGAGEDEAPARNVGSSGGGSGGGQAGSGGAAGSGG